MENEIEEWKKNVLAEYCVECGGQCCSCNLILSEEQVDLIFGDARDRLDSLGLPMLTELSKEQGDMIFGATRDRLGSLGLPMLSETDSGFKTNFSKNDPCPQLQEGRCVIHKNELRPAVCKQFPVYVDEKRKIILRHNIGCHAASLENLGELFLAALNQGYRIENVFPESGVREVTRTQILSILAQKDRESRK